MTMYFYEEHIDIDHENNIADYDINSVINSQMVYCCDPGTGIKMYHIRHDNNKELTGKREHD